jgi:hypothetical protein
MDPQAQQGQLSPQAQALIQAVQQRRQQMGGAPMGAPMGGQPQPPQGMPGAGGMPVPGGMPQGQPGGQGGGQPLNPQTQMVIKQALLRIAQLM